MEPIEQYVQEADLLSQEVIDTWGGLHRAGHGKDLTDDFRQVLELACQYREKQRTADNRREFISATNSEIANEAIAAETASRVAFARVYKAFRERNTHAQGQG
jgi:hypothetical protein